MTTNSFMDQLKAFGARLGLPKVDVDKLVDIQLKKNTRWRLLLLLERNARAHRTSSARS
jgi:hypothetical protein